MRQEFEFFSDDLCRTTGTITVGFIVASVEAIKILHLAGQLKVAPLGCGAIVLDLEDPWSLLSLSRRQGRIIFVGSLGTIVIKCKDLRIIQLDIPGMEESLNIASSIEALSTLDSIALLYPFFYRPMFEVIEDGWHSFLPEREFELLSSVTNEWRLSYVNKDFSICPSYPPIVTVPKSIDDESLWKVATFRHGGRFPVLSYYHKKNGMTMDDTLLEEGISQLQRDLECQLFEKMENVLLEFSCLKVENALLTSQSLQSPEPKPEVIGEMEAKSSEVC
ncbi:hypothetical protein lerEdw1_015359 [Lerista edwardsae]|nr:hypothetical protein lerEdw1_015359 [Lerista edwardsae]